MTKEKATQDILCYVLAIQTSKKTYRTIINNKDVTTLNTFFTNRNAKSRESFLGYKYYKDAKKAKKEIDKKRCVILECSILKNTTYNFFSATNTYSFTSIYINDKVNFIITLLRQIYYFFKKEEK